MTSDNHALALSIIEAKNAEVAALRKRAEAAEAERDQWKREHAEAVGRLGDARAERDALRKVCEALPKAIDAAMNYIELEVSACSGLKCREGHCALYYGAEDAEAWVAKARASYAVLKHAAALDAALAVQPTTEVST